MTFLGYTNLPGNNLRFALFSASNQAPYAIKRRGSWVEIEGTPDHKAETINPSLPGYPREPVLKPAGSFRVAIGEPSFDSERRRWRLSMSYAPYTWRERWFDFSLRRKLPLRLGSIVLVDTERLLSPTNNVTVATGWLTQD